MQTALRLIAPYGTAFQSTMSPMPGAPMEVWLMHDTTKGGEVIEWLRNLITEYENQLHQLAQAQVMAQQSAAQAQTEPVHNELGPSAPKMHDWGGVYKLGKPCLKCGVLASGFEPACK